MRPRTRPAVSGFVDQIGSMIFVTRRGIDALYRQRANDRKDISRKRIAPLLSVLGIAPGGLVRRDIGVSTLLKRHRLGGFEQLRCTKGVALLRRQSGLYLQPTARALEASSRALARLTAGNAPSPIVRARPASMKRKTHELWLTE